MKRGFTLPEVMIANLVLLILVGGFAGITEQIFEQMRQRKQKAEIASRLDWWTASKQDKSFSTGIYRENISWPGTNAELNWQVLPKKQNLITIQFQVKSREATPKVLAEWRTAFYAP
ncbi:MAG: hypothetical protein MAG581_01244 [Deltaproteobacteria bacterium]|jgi:prepilin-type N-terminal cleavage/methylation domain-containing protein|nr:hypothetical protein [Deltaproteobacteria bacterium]